MSLNYDPPTAKILSVAAHIETMHTTSTPPGDNVVKITLAPKHVGAIVALAKNLTDKSKDKSWRKVKQLLRTPDEIHSLLNAIPQKIFKSSSNLEELRTKLEKRNLDAYQCAQALALHWHFNKKQIARIRKIAFAKSNAKTGKIISALNKVLTFKKQPKLRDKDVLFAFGMDFSIHLALLRPIDNETDSRRLGIKRNMLTSTMTGIKISFVSKLKRTDVDFSIEDVQAWDTYTSSPAFPSILTRATTNPTRPVFSVSFVRDPSTGKTLNVSVLPLHINVNFPYLQRIVNKCTVAKPAISAIQPQKEEVWLKQVSAQHRKKCKCTDC